MTEKGLNILCNYPWPGNVRELKNLIERLVIMVEKDVIDESDVPPPYNPEGEISKNEGNNQLFLLDKLKDAKRAFEKEFIYKKLAQYNNNITKTAEAIGVERSYLHKKLKIIKDSSFAPPIRGLQQIKSSHKSTLW